MPFKEAKPVWTLRWAQRPLEVLLAPRLVHWRWVQEGVNRGRMWHQVTDHCTGRGQQPRWCRSVATGDRWSWRPAKEDVWESRFAGEECNIADQLVMPRTKVTLTGTNTFCSYPLAWVCTSGNVVMIDPVQQSGLFPFLPSFPLFLFFNYPSLFHDSSHSMVPLCLIEFLGVEKQSNASHPVVVETMLEMARLRVSWAEEGVNVPF